MTGSTVGMPYRIVFVCTGNTCRSPLAEVIARDLIRTRELENMVVESAGIAAYPGDPASPEAINAAGDNGLDLTSHRSRPLSREVVDAADLILAMTPGHVTVVEASGDKGNTHLLSDFSAADGGAGPEGVPDPFGGGPEAYIETFQTLERLVGTALDRIADAENL